MSGINLAAHSGTFQCFFADFCPKNCIFITFPICNLGVPSAVCGQTGQMSGSLRVRLVSRPVGRASRFASLSWEWTFFTPCCLTPGVGMLMRRYEKHMACSLLFHQKVYIKRPGVSWYVAFLCSDQYEDMWSTRNSCAYIIANSNALLSIGECLCWGTDTWAHL